MGREPTRRRGICTSVSKHPKEIARGLKRIRESKMGKPSSARIIQDVYLTLKAFQIVYCANGDAVEGLADRNGHRRKVLGEGKSVSWGGARTKGKGSKCEITKKVFLHSDFLKLYLNKKHKITEFFPGTTVFYDYKTSVARQWGKNIESY